MTVYVDDMRASYGRMIMCHMIADTDEELHAMADRIGVARRWWQSPEKTSGSHYDIALSKRELAVKLGAVRITWRQAGMMNAHRKATGRLGTPTEATTWALARSREREVRRMENEAAASAMVEQDPSHPLADLVFKNIQGPT